MKKKLEMTRNRGGRTWRTIFRRFGPKTENQKASQIQWGSAELTDHRNEKAHRGKNRDRPRMGITLRQPSTKKEKKVISGEKRRESRTLGMGFELKRIGV